MWLRLTPTGPAVQDAAGSGERHEAEARRHAGKCEGGFRAKPNAPKVNRNEQGRAACSLVSLGFQGAALTFTLMPRGGGVRADPHGHLTIYFHSLMLIREANQRKKPRYWEGNRTPTLSTAADLITTGL